MRIGDCLFYLNFVWFGFWCMRKLQGSNLYGFLCLQAGKGDGSYMQLCSIFLCIGAGNNLPQYVQPKHPLI